MKKILFPVFLLAVFSLQPYAMESSLSGIENKGLGDPTPRRLDGLIILGTEQKEKDSYSNYLPVAEYIFSQMGLKEGDFTIEKGSTGITSQAIYLGQFNKETELVIKLFKNNQDFYYRRELESLQGIATSPEFKAMYEKFSTDPKCFKLTYPLAFYTYGEDIFVVLKGASGGDHWIGDSEPSLKWLGHAMARFAIEFSEPWQERREINFERCIVHGDLKRENMKFSSDGTVHLLDIESMYRTLPKAIWEPLLKKYNNEEYLTQKYHLNIFEMWCPRLTFKNDFERIFCQGYVISGANQDKYIDDYSKIYISAFSEEVLKMIDELPEEDQKTISFQDQTYSDSDKRSLKRDIETTLGQMIVDIKRKRKEKDEKNKRVQEEIKFKGLNSE